MGIDRLKKLKSALTTVKPYLSKDDFILLEKKIIMDYKRAMIKTANINSNQDIHDLFGKELAGLKVGVFYEDTNYKGDEKGEHV